MIFLRSILDCETGGGDGSQYARIHSCRRFSVINLEPLHVVSGEVKNVAMSSLQFDGEFFRAARDFRFTVRVFGLPRIHCEDDPFVVGNLA